MYFPVTEQKAVSIVLFSSPDSNDPNHWFRRFKEENINDIIAIGFERICSDCLKLDVSEWGACTHTEFEGSLLKDYGVSKLDKMLDEEELANEVYGYCKETKILAFDKKTLEWLVSKENWKHLDEDDVLYYFAFVDTNFAGLNESTFFVFAYSKKKSGKNENKPKIPKTYICWMSSLSTKNPEDSKDYFLKNIEEFRYETSSYDKPLIIAYETVSNYSAYEAYNLIKRKAKKDKSFQKIYFVKEPKWVGTEKERQGVGLWHSRKNQLIKNLKSGLDDAKILIRKSIGTSDVKSINTSLNEMKNELSRFRHFDMDVIMKKRMDRGKYKEINNKNNSGKFKINGKLFNDDRALSLMFGYYMLEFFTNDRSCFLQRMEINNTIKKIF